MKKIISIIFAVSLVSGIYAQKLDRSIKPKAAPAPEIKLGTPESFTLPNGLKVFVVEKHTLPEVSFSLSLDIDPILEGDMIGYISAAGQLLERGTKNRTKQQLNEEIDFIGATLSTYSTGIYASSLKKHEDKLLTLMSDVLMNAEFKQEELDKIKKQTKSSLESSKDDPDAIAANVRSVLLYSNKHPYGEVTTEKSVDNITLEKCNEYYHTYFKPNVAYLAIVGDITLAEAKPLVEKYFGSWKKAEVPTHKYRTPFPSKTTQVDFVHKEGATQSVINVTYPVNLKHNSPDVVKARIMNAILGGSATARLFMDLREGHGFTYGAYSRLSADELVGSFNASAKVRNEVTDSSIIQFLFELNKMVKENVTEEELQNVKNYMTGTFAYSLQDPKTIARFAINTQKYNLPADFYATYLKQIAAVTIADVKAMAEKYIKPNNAYILVVGDKSLANKLKDFSADKKIHFYDKEGKDWVEPLKPAPAGMTAQMVISNSIKAIYGLPKGKTLDKKLKKIKDRTVKMNASIQGQTINVTRYQKAPNKFSNTMAMGTMVVQKQTFNGTTGKVSGMQGNKDITGKELEDLKLSSTMFLDTKYDEFGFKFKLLGIEPINGKDAYKLEVTKPNGDKETQWYNVATGLEAKSLSTKESEQLGGSVVITVLYSDYKEVNGIKYAHKIKQTFGPQTLDMEVLSVETNTKLSDDIFE